MRQRELSEITDGTAQDARQAPALGDHYFDVDERSFEDLVVQAAEFSKSIRYFNAQNIAEESWRDLFTHDDAVVMAEILTTDSARMEAEFLPYLQSPAAGANYLLRFSLRIDHWYQRLLIGEDESAHVLSRQIRAVIEQKLKSVIQQVAVYFPVTERTTTPSQAKSNPFSVFHPMWGFMQPQRRPVANTVDAEAVLRAGLYALVSAISYLKPITASQLALNLKDGNHNPALALFLAFARLLGKTQEKINTFTARHRDFYYNDVLQMTAKDQVPDSTFLVLKLDASRSSGAGRNCIQCGKGGRRRRSDLPVRCCPAGNGCAGAKRAHAALSA